jgi:hypothetical protein
MTRNALEIWAGHPLSQICHTVVEADKAPFKAMAKARQRLIQPHMPKKLVVIAGHKENTVSIHF